MNDKLISAVDSLQDDAEELCGAYCPSALTNALEYNPNISSVGEYDVDFENNSVWLKVGIDKEDYDALYKEGWSINTTAFRELFPGYINYHISVVEKPTIYIVTFSFDI